MKISYKIKEIRKSQGLSQAQLARLAQTTQQHVSLIEQGKAGIEVETLRKLLAALGYELAFEKASGGFAAQWAAREKSWQAFSGWRSDAAPLAPAARLRQIGELAELYASRHGSPIDRQALARQAEDVADWRRLLSKARVT